MATDNLNGGNSSTSGNGDSVLKDSPWGRLSEVTSLDNVSNGFASATGSQSGGANSGDSPYGGNPFANFGNPNASGNAFTGGTNPWASLNNSGGGGNTGNSPVSGDTSGGSISSSGGSNFGGIDFGSASQSVSFQDRVQTDQLVNSSLSDNAISVPTSNANFGGGGPVSGSNGDSVAQVSPFDQLEQNLNDYLKPFSNGGTPNASDFGDPGKINPFNANLNGNSSSGNSSLSADDTRNALLGSIDTTNTDTLGAQIEDKVVNLANSYINSTPTVDGNAPTAVDSTPTVNGNVPTAVDSTPTVDGNVPTAVDNTPAGNDNVFPQLASDNGSNIAQSSPITDTSNQLADGSSKNAGDQYPSLNDFYNFLSAAQSGDDSLIGSSIPDGTPSFVADSIKDNASNIADIIGQYQNQAGNFIGSSTDGNSVITGSSDSTQDYPAQVAYYQGLTSQFQQNPQEAVNTLISENQFGGGSNQFGGGSNQFGGGSPFGV